MRIETVIFLLEFQEIRPLTSTAEGLYSVMSWYRTNKFLLVRTDWVWQWLEIIVIPLLFLPWILIYIKRGFVRYIYYPKYTVSRKCLKILTNVSRADCEGVEGTLTVPCVRTVPAVTTTCQRLVRMSCNLNVTHTVQYWGRINFR